MITKIKSIIRQKLVYSFFCLFFLPLMIVGCGPNIPSADMEAVNEKILYDPDMQDPNYEAFPKWTTEDGKVKVALLLPLTGSSFSDTAKQMRQAGELAVFEKADKNFTLITKDTQGTPQGAAQAAIEAMSEGATLILGPVFSPSVNAVAPLVRQRGINMIAFSNSNSLAGDGVFVFGFTPEQEVHRAVAYATTRGIKRYAIVAPNTPYGEVSLRALHHSTQRFGGDIIQVLRYATKEDPAQIIQKLDYDEVEAVLVPETGRRLKWTLSYIKHFQPQSEEGEDPITPIQIIGMRSWESPKILKDPGTFGAWLASHDRYKWRLFEARYNNTYGNKPHKIAGIAYDAVGFAAHIAKSPEGADFSMMRLTQLSGFDGVFGNFRLNPTGQVDRGLGVFEITPRGLKALAPPTDSFL